MSNNPARRLAAFFGWKDGVPGYTANTVFSQQKLLDVTAQDVVDFLKIKAFHTLTPEGERPKIYCRSDNLKKYKSGISVFMPRKNMKWDPVTLTGNPTMSCEVNDLIRYVERAEVQGWGAPDQSRRALEWSEFINVLLCIRTFFATGTGATRALIYPLLAILTLQWQLIGRIDDVMQLEKSCIARCYAYDFALTAQIKVSKTTKKKQDSRTQIIFGAMEPLVCPLLNLAVFLESESTAGTLLLFGQRSARSVQDAMRSIWDCPFFRKIRSGLLGTHSFRKGAATFASRCGMIKDWIDIRGRWAGIKRQVNTYIDVNVPYPDAKVAACLTGVRGPCKYVAKTNRGITDAFLESIVPNAVNALGADVGRVLALPLLWAAFEGGVTIDGTFYEFMPPRMAEEIKNAYFRHVGGHVMGNVVEKVGLKIRKQGDQLKISPILLKRCGGGLGVGVRNNGGDNTDNEAGDVDGAAMDVMEGSADADEEQEGGGEAEAGAGAGKDNEEEIDAIFAQINVLQHGQEELVQHINAAFCDQKR
jgi:hypothetical protein